MKFFRLSLIALFLFACSQVKLLPGGGDNLPDINSGKAVVKYNGGTIHQGYLDLLAKINPRIKTQLDNPFMRRQVLNSLIDQEVMYNESVRQGLNQDKDVLEKAALYKKVIIAQALLDRSMEKKAKEEYDQKKDTDFTKVEISHIQINFKPDEKPEGGPAVHKEETPVTDAEKQAALKKAQDIRARLNAGEDFAKVALEVSDDKISKNKGGSLGPVSRADKRLARRGMEQAGELAFTLKKGEISEPIESKKGYHIIKVDSDPTAIPFEEAEKMIRFQIQKTAKDELLADLRKKADVKFLEKEPEAPPVALSPEGAPEAPAATGTAPTAAAPAPEGQTQPATPSPAPAANPSAPDQVFYKNTPMRQVEAAPTAPVPAPTAAAPTPAPEAAAAPAAPPAVAPAPVAPTPPAPTEPTAPSASAPAAPAPAPQGNAPMGGT